MLKTKMFAGISMILAAAGLLSLSFAQTNQAPAAPAAQSPMLSRVTVTQIPSAMVGEWRDFQKNEVIPLMKKAGVVRSYVLGPATFGEAGEFIIIRPMKDLSEIDAPSPLIGALGQDMATTLVAGVTARSQRFNAKSRTFMMTGRPDLYIAMPAGYEAKLAVMGTTDVAPGRTEEYEKYFKEMLPVIGKTNVKGLLVGRVGLGGNPNQYIMFAMIDSFTDLAQFGPAFTKASAEMKIAPMPPGIATHMEYRVLRYAPDLSIQPAEPKPAK